MMLIKTAEPSYQIERMLEKSAQRRRLARRQQHTCEALQAAATAISVAVDVMPYMTASSRVAHHAKPYAVPIKPSLNFAAGRISHDAPAVTRWNIFGDIFPS